MKKNILLFLLSLSLNSYSQKDTTLNRTVIVENNYNPEVMDATKINVLPKVEEFKAPKSVIKYTHNATPYTSYTNSLLELEVPEPNSNSMKNGALRIGYGNYGNVEISAKYNLNLNTKNRLSFDAGLNGMNGELNDWNEHSWDSRFYTSHINAGYSHQFKNYLLSVSGKYKSEVFNYINHDGFDKQHNTSSDVNATIKSLNSDNPMSFYAQVGYSTFDQKYAIADLKQGSQGDFYINGDVWANIDESSNVGIEFKMDNISYSSDRYKGYTSLRMNPYYSISGENWSVRLGAHADYQTAFKKGVEFSPDILAKYSIAERYQLYAKIGGGVELNDFYRLSALSPYFIMENQYLSTSTLLDSKVGFKASPINEMWFHLFAGYRVNKNELSPFINIEPNYTLFLQGKTFCTYGGGEFRYGFKDIFDINAKVVYYKWSCSDLSKDEFLASKPELTLDIDLKYKVIEKLFLNGGFSFVKRVDNRVSSDTHRYTYGDINNLYIGGEYEIFNNISIFAKINNILNADNFSDYCYPMEKFNFLGGLSFKF